MDAGRLLKIIEKYIEDSRVSLGVLFELSDTLHLSQAEVEMLFDTIKNNGIVLYVSNVDAIRLVKKKSQGHFLTYTDFSELFQVVSKKRQYQLTDLLFAEGIILVDEYNQNESIHDDSDDIVLPIEENDYDEFNFSEEESNDNTDNSYDNSSRVIQKKAVKQSNEVLCKLFQSGSRQAGNDLCIKNERLVSKIASIYFKRYNSDLEFEDLLQAGFIGLLKAAEAFDTGKGYQFSTYATYWIRQSISRAIIDTGFTIRVPVHMVEQINKLTLIDKKYDDLGLPYKERVKMVATELGTNVEKVESLLSIKYQFLNVKSLDDPIGEEMDTPLGELLESKEDKDIFEMVSDNEAKETINKVLDTLTSREKKIIELRFGLKDGQARTLEEVGKEMGVTRERVRQIVEKGLRKLRRPANAALLRDFYKD